MLFQYTVHNIKYTCLALGTVIREQQVKSWAPVPTADKEKSFNFRMQFQRSWSELQQSQPTCFLSWQKSWSFRCRGDKNSSLHTHTLHKRSFHQLSVHSCKPSLLFHKFSFEFLWECVPPNVKVIRTQPRPQEASQRVSSKISVDIEINSSTVNLLLLNGSDTDLLWSWQYFLRFNSIWILYPYKLYLISSISSS